MNKPVTIPAIPTLYRGVMMRSRLEARWAAFFDTLRWPWEYEPIDLAGYIPDFILGFDAGDLLVEVKPRNEDMGLAQSKIDVSTWGGEALIVVSAATTEIGSLAEREEGFAPMWNEAVIFGCLSCGMPSVRSGSFSWHCRICGAHDGNAHVGDFDPTEAWNEAANRVQWRKPE